MNEDVKVSELEGLGRPVWFAVAGLVGGLISVYPIAQSFLIQLGTCAAAILGLVTLARRVSVRRLRQSARTLCVLVWLETLLEVLSFVPGLEAQWLLMGLWALEITCAAWLFLLLSAFCDSVGAKRAGWWWKKTALIWVLGYGLLLISGLIPLFFGDERLEAVMFHPIWSDLIEATVLVVLVIPALASVTSASLTYSASQVPTGRCIGCGYDLSGLTEKVCPECGTEFERDMQRDDVPTFEPFPLRLAAAAVGVLALLAVPVWLQLPANGLEAYKPAWLLVRDAAADGEGTGGSDQWDDSFGPGGANDRIDTMRRYWFGGSEKARSELIRRIEDGSIGEETALILIEKVLELQKVVGYRLDNWPHVFEACYEAGHVSPEQFREYFLNSMRFDLRARPIVQAGGVLPFEVVAVWRGVNSQATFLPSPDRATQSTVVAFEMLKCGDANMLLPAERRASRNGSGGYTSYGFAKSALTQPDLMPHAPDEPGIYDVSARVRISWDNRGTTWIPSRAQLESLGLPADWTVDLKAQIEVVEPSLATVQTVSDPSSVNTLLKQREFILSESRQFSMLMIDPAPGSSVSFDGNYVLDVLLRIDAEEVPIGVFIWSQASLDDHNYLELPPRAIDRLRAFDGPTVEVIMRPNAAAAERTIAVDSIWDGPDIEITIERGGRD